MWKHHLRKAGETFSSQPQLICHNPNSCSVWLILALQLFEGKKKQAGFSAGLSENEQEFVLGDGCDSMLIPNIYLTFFYIFTY